MIRAAVWTAAIFAVATACLLALGPTWRAVEPALLIACGASLLAGVPLLYRRAPVRADRAVEPPEPAMHLEPARATTV